MNEGEGRRWSLQTIIAVVAALGAVAGVLFSWGSTLSGLQRDTDRNTASVAQLTIGLERNDSKTDQLDTRVVALEKIAADAITLRRELEGTLGEFKADIEVIKSILQRIEKQQPQDRP
jgi:septal ring factor EnvC (AmiA/AmiB activator)